MSSFYILVIVVGVFGGLGGLISFWDPNVRFLNTGWVGHIFAGIAGAILSVALGIAIFKIEMDGFGQAWDYATQLTVLPELIYIAGLAVLGGYASLSLIPTLSNLALQRLREEVKGVKDEVIKDKEKTSKVSAEDSFTKGRFVFMVEKDCERALYWFNEALKENPGHAGSWSNKAMMLSRLKRYSEAVEAVEKAVIYDPDDWKKWHNLACYKSRLGLNFSEIKPILEKSMFIVTKNTDQMAIFKESLETDEDFANLRDIEDFTTFINSIN